MRRVVLCFFFCLIAAACRREAHHHAAPAFYYWKTVYAPTAYEAKRLEDAHCSRLYVRCFDVAADPATGAAKPAGIIRNLDRAGRKMQYVPVVFITQDVLLRLRPAQLPALAKNVTALLTALFTKLPAPGEVQLDCDWTTGTRDIYFALLRALRNEPFFRHKILSCTIRLHQVKYRLRSGIPPADRGLLMCYNMGNLRQPGARNSILDVPLARDYLHDLAQYPLPLDVALPLFCWCLQFRKGRLVGILRDVAPEDVVHSDAFRSQGKHLYTCRADTSWMGYAFQAGDELRVEIPEAAGIQAMAEYTARHIRNDSLRVILFHSDSLTLSKHPPDEIEAIYGAYR